MVIELSGVQFGLKSYVWLQNETSTQREFDLESQAWFRTKIARPEVQLPLYYIHFEITQFNSLNTRTTRTTKPAKFAKQWPFLFVFHFPAMWLVSFKKTLKSYWLFCFTVSFSLAEKKMRFRAKNSAIWE